MLTFHSESIFIKMNLIGNLRYFSDIIIVVVVQVSIISKSCLEFAYRLHSIDWLNEGIYTRPKKKPKNTADFILMSIHDIFESENIKFAPPSSP